jgi:hypothetical protein
MSALTITTIQTNLSWEDKRANLQMLEDKIAALPDKTEIVVYAAQTVCRNDGRGNNGMDETYQQ